MKRVVHVIMVLMAIPLLTLIVLAIMYLVSSFSIYRASVDTKQSLVKGLDVVNLVSCMQVERGEVGAGC